MSEKPTPVDVAWIETNQAAGLILSLIVAAIAVSVGASDWAYEIQPDGFVLGFFPGVGIVWMIVCTLAIAFDHARSQPFNADDNFGYSSWGWITGLTLGWFGYIVVMVQVGFAATTFLFMVGLFRLLGVGSWLHIASCSTICVVVVFALFFAIGITLPIGELWFSFL